MLALATAVDLLDALRLLEGRRRALGQQLSPGAVVLRQVAEGTIRVSEGHAVEAGAPEGDDDPVGPYLYNLDEVALRLRLSQRSVKRLIASGGLRAVKVGGATRIRPDDFSVFLETLEPAEPAAS